MIEYELDIPSLTSDGIQMGYHTFTEMRELNSSSITDELIMIEMLILLINSFDRRVTVYERMRVFHKDQIVLVFNLSFIQLLIHHLVVVSYTNELIVFVHYHCYPSSLSSY